MNSNSMLFLDFESPKTIIAMQQMLDRLRLRRVRKVVISLEYFEHLRVAQRKVEQLRAILEDTDKITISEEEQRKLCDDEE